MTLYTKHIAFWFGFFPKKQGDFRDLGQGYLVKINDGRRRCPGLAPPHSWPSVPSHTQSPVILSEAVGVTESVFLASISRIPPFTPRSVVWHEGLGQHRKVCRGKL